MATATPLAPVAHRRRFAGLDVLRGVAVGLVLLRHGWPEEFGGAGIVGVTMFFTLSGYLITGIIAREVTGTGGFSYRRFYRNRALRLLPALVLALAGFSLIEGTTNLCGQAHQIPRTWLTGLTFIVDIPHLDMAPNMSHMWSLAVEEQFYLLWPAALIWAIRRDRTVRVVAVALVAWLVACSASLLLVPGGPAFVYPLPSPWPVTLIVGAALALFRDRLPTTVPRWAVWLSVTGLAGMCFVPHAKARAASYLLGGPLVSIATVVLIVAVLEGRPMRAVLAPLRFLGLVSYAAYLWNYPIVGWLTVGMTNHALAAWLSIPLTVAAAALSWLVAERPAARWKSRLDSAALHAAQGGQFEVAGRGGGGQILGEAEVPAGGGAGLVGGDAGVQGDHDELAGVRVGSEDTQVGDDALGTAAA
jgi:peptidoglycan/LPS O-acetylase OafA/YrhL